MLLLFAGVAAFFLDAFLGHPHWLPNPAKGLEAVVYWYQRTVRPRFARSARGEFWCGAALAVMLPLVTFGVALAVCLLARAAHPALYVVVEAALGWMALEQRSLSGKCRGVWQRLWENDLPAAREAAGTLVERDTERMTRAGIIRAAVETASGGFPGGAAAPLVYFFLGGAPLALCWRAVETLDRAAGQDTARNARFGKAASRLASASAFLPARIGAWFWILAARATGHNAIRARYVWRRDGRPAGGAAETEAACAGALGIRLGGPYWYRGRRREQPAFGDDRRAVQRVDILRTNRMLFMAGFLLLDGCVAVRLAVVAQGNVAMGTLRDLAAFRALERGRVGTAGPQDEHLLPGVHRRGDFPDEFPRQAAFHAPFPPLRHRVDDLDLRFRSPVEPFGQVHPGETAGFGVVQGFERGRCTAQQDMGLLDEPQHDGGVAPVVARGRRVLLVGGVMLFVYNDEPEPVMGKEQG